MRVFQYLAQLVQLRNLSQTKEQVDHNNALIRITADRFMPKTFGTEVDRRSTEEELIFRVNYYDQDSVGTEWTEYYVFVRPSLLNGGFKIEVRGLTQADMQIPVLELILQEFRNALELAVD